MVLNIQVWAELLCTSCILYQKKDTNSKKVKILMTWEIKDVIKTMQIFVVDEI